MSPTLLPQAQQPVEPPFNTAFFYSENPSALRSSKVLLGVNNMNNIGVLSSRIELPYLISLTVDDYFLGIDLFRTARSSTEKDDPYFYVVLGGDSGIPARLLDSGKFLYENSNLMLGIETTHKIQMLEEEVRKLRADNANMERDRKVGKFWLGLERLRHEKITQFFQGTLPDDDVVFQLASMNPSIYEHSLEVESENDGTE